MATNLRRNVVTKLWQFGTESSQSVGCLQWRQKSLSAPICHNRLSSRRSCRRNFVTTQKIKVFTIMTNSWRNSNFRPKSPPPPFDLILKKSNFPKLGGGEKYIQQKNRYYINEGVIFVWWLSKYVAKFPINIIKLLFEYRCYICLKYTARQFA